MVFFLLSVNWAYHRVTLLTETDALPPSETAKQPYSLPYS